MFTSDAFILAIAAVENDGFYMFDSSKPGLTIQADAPDEAIAVAVNQEVPVVGMHRG